MPGRASPHPTHEPDGSQGSDSLKGIALYGRLRPPGERPGERTFQSTWRIKQ